MTVTDIGDASSFATQLQTAKSKGLLVVVDFYATWCGPCKAIAPTVESLSSKYAKEAVFLKVDVDRVSDVARDAGVTAMPSFGFYGEGKLVELMKGADARGLEERIKKYAATYTKNPFKGPGYTLAGASASTAPPPAASSSSRPAAAAHGSTTTTTGTQQPRKNPWADPNFMPGKKTTASTASSPSSATAAAAPSLTSHPSTHSTTTSSASSSAPAAAPPAAASTSTPSAAVPSTSSVTSAPARPPAAAAAVNAPAARLSSSSLSSSSADPVLLQQLLDMGFDHIRSEKSLIFTHNRDVEEAVGWIMEHQDDPDIDIPMTMNGNITNARTTPSAPSMDTTMADPAINPDDLDEDAQVLYAELMKKKAKESATSVATGTTTSSSSSSSYSAAPAAKKVSDMSSEEKMAWLANKRAAVKAKKEQEALEKVKNDYKSTKGMTSALNELKEQKEELERQRFIASKKKEEADKERQRRDIREKLAAQKEARRLETERQMAAAQKAKQTQAGAK